MTVNSRAATDTYAECQSIIVESAKQFAKRYCQRDVEEIISMAHFFYFKAYLKYDYTLGVPFDLYCRQQIWYGLREYNRKLRFNHIRCPRVEMPEHINPPKKSLFDLNCFMLNMSDDACTVVRELLSSRSDPYFVIVGPKGLIRSRGKRRAMRDYMKDMGWSDERINYAFVEIKERLR